MQVRLQHAPDLEVNAKIVSLLPFQLLCLNTAVNVTSYYLLFTLQGNDTTIFVQMTYESQQEVQGHIPVVPKHMADICTSGCLALQCI